MRPLQEHSRQIVFVLSISLLILIFVKKMSLAKIRSLHMMSKIPEREWRHVAVAAESTQAEVDTSALRQN